MATIFNFNSEAILTGLIDHYCLVCEVYLQYETEIYDHIKTISHENNLASCPYYQKSKIVDRIRKVKYGYYCEVCNVFMRTPNNVGLHVTEDKHNDKKVSLVKRVRHFNTIVDKYGKVIAMENWHGLTDDGTCVLCETEYGDKNAHTRENEHLLNLVRKTAEFHSVDSIYRKLDEKTSHCIICNDVVLLVKISRHNEEDKHLSNSRCREIYNKSEVDEAITTPSIQDQKQNVPSAGNISALKECQSSISEITDRKEAILNSLEQFQKCSLNINFETDTALCKKCNENVDFNCESIKNHIDHHKDVKLDVGDTQKLDATITTDTAVKTQNSSDYDHYKIDEATGSNVEDPNIYSAENFITRNHYNKDAYCRVCETRLSSSLKCMKEHVNGGGHKKKMANKKKADSLSMMSDNKGNTNSATKFTEKHATVKQNSKLFIKSLRAIETGDQRLIVVNEKFLIDSPSFLLISRGNNYGLKCLSCEVTLAGMIDLELHLKFTAHAKSMESAPVIINYENEFIRECRPGIYHCGYCNFVKDSIVGLEKHLKSSFHLTGRRSAEKRLSEFMVVIRLSDYQERLFADILFKDSLHRLFGRTNRFDDSDSD